MKIDQLKINAYGKLKEKQMDFDSHMNVIYGKNEAGKSTLFSFLMNCFYGISKNKKGKDISDFDKYRPWIGEEFSGKVEYELDNKEKFEIFRDFKKKNPQLFNEEKEDILKKFSMDKNKGSQFFYEQTKVEEELFLSTLVVNQQAVKLEMQDQNRLIQRMANLVQTGQDDVSFQRAIDRLDRRQLEEIGTERSREKPINRLTKKIEQLEREKQELEKYETIKYEIEEKKNQLKNEILESEEKNHQFREMKLIYEKEKIENEKIKLKLELKHENEEKIELAKKEREEIQPSYQRMLEEQKREKKEKKICYKVFIGIFFLTIFLNGLSFFLVKNKLLNGICLFMIPMVVILFLFFKNKIEKKGKRAQEELDQNKLKINQVNQEIQLLEENNQELEKQIEELKNGISLRIKKQSFPKEELNSLEAINLEIQKIESERTDQKIRLHTLELDYQNIEPKLENLSHIEEDLAKGKEQIEHLKKLEKSIELAKEVLETSYEEMKKTVTPKFTQELSKTVAEITNGKYTNIRLQDEVGMMVELENGNYMPVSRLSIGTIDQLYLSLRLAMAEELSEEKMPIILDEAFAYYDTERLKNSLSYLSKRFQDHQILLFTCTDRETKLLEELNIPYHLNVLN